MVYSGFIQRFFTHIMYYRFDFDHQKQRDTKPKYACK